MEELWKLKFGIFKRQGWNSKGRITVYNWGGGCKWKLNLVDFKWELLGVPGRVIKIEKGINYTGNIGLVAYSCGIFGYILLSEGVCVGDIVISSDSVFENDRVSRLGSVFKLKDILVGEYIHSIEKYPGSGGVYLRSAGNYGKVVKHIEDLGLVLVKLRKGYLRIFDDKCKCVVGSVSNVGHRFNKLSKAGENRWWGRRPSVRGVAMNPVDHPHGGGEGKTSGGRCSVTPWGKLTKGKKTRSVKKKNKFIIESKKY